MGIDDIVRRLSGVGAKTVLVDGRSGSGKSTLAQQLRSAWAASTVISLDDVYPGWDGLDWTVEHIHTALLKPRAAGRPARWRSWDWTVGAPAQWHTVDPGLRLIVEGVGVLTPGNRPLVDLGIWVEAPDTERKRRALLRDGDTYRPHWDRWATQEEVFISRYDPRSVADWIVTETPSGQVWTPKRAG